jgi:hypothetical protein
VVGGRQLSYRRRRRLLALGGVVVVAGGIATAVLLVPSVKNADVTPAGSSTTPPPPPQTQTQPKPRPQPHRTRLTAAEKRRLLSSISLFVRTAVAREHPERSWPIVDPSLREGLTKREWASGNIPVVPYPAVGFDLIRLQSLVGSTALVEIILVPKAKSRLVRKTFEIQLQRQARPPHLWAVSSWVPEGVSQAQIDLNRPQSPKVIAEAAHPTHLSAMWIWLPLGTLLAGVILVPAFVLTRDARRSRRIARRYG